MKKSSKSGKSEISESEYLKHTNLNPDDFEMIDKEDNSSTHLKNPKKEQ